MNNSELLDIITRDLKSVVPSHNGKRRIKAQCADGLINQYDDKIVEIPHDVVGKIWIASDTHFYHSNIIKYTNRPYLSTDEMNSKMIQAFHQTVPEDGIVLFLGDFGFAGITKLNSVVHQIDREIWSVVGNHDLKRRSDEILKLNFAKTNLFYTLTDFMIDGIYLPNLLFTHYPLETNNIPGGWFNVHGHTHDSMDISDKHINVSWERTAYQPVSLEDHLLEIVLTRTNSLENRHEQN